MNRMITEPTEEPLTGFLRSCVEQKLRDRSIPGVTVMEIVTWHSSWDNEYYTVNLSHNDPCGHAEIRISSEVEITLIFYPVEVTDGES